MEKRSIRHPASPAPASAPSRDSSSWKDTPSPWRLILILILLLGVFSRAWRLGDKILWIDEGISWKVASFKTVSEIIEYNRFEEHSPLPQIIDHFWIRLAGDSVFALHLQSLLWSVAALGVFAWMAFAMLPWRAALGATAALSLSAFIPEFAQMLRYPSLGSFTAHVWLFMLLKYRKSAGSAWLLIYTVFLVASLRIHLYSLFAVIGISLFVAFFRGSFGPFSWRIHAAGAIAVATIIPKFLLMKSTGISSLARPVPLSDALHHLAGLPVGGIVRAFFHFCTGRIVSIETLSIPSLIIIAGAFGAVLIAALFHGTHRTEARFCAVVLGGAVLFGWMGMIFRGIYFHTQYYVPLYGLFCLMLGLGADRLCGRKPFLFPALLITYFLFSFNLLHIYWQRLDRPENQKTLLEHVAAHEREGDFIVLSPPYTFAFDYYWKGTIPVHDFSDDYDPVTTPHNNVFRITAQERQINEERLRRWHRDVASRYKRVWVFWMLGAINTEDHAGLARRWLDERFEKLETRPYRMIPFSDEYTGEMVLYRIRPPTPRPPAPGR
ncbi:MAG: hypothetical protein AB1742_00665 [bacterium]